MSYAQAKSGIKSGSPVVESGVTRLNRDLAHVFDRIEAATQRVSHLADEFGTPNHPDDPSPEGPVVTTNEHMTNLNRALVRLESTISRIDNQD